VGSTLRANISPQSREVLPVLSGRFPRYRQRQPEKSGKSFCLPICEISGNRAGYAEQGLTRDAMQGTRRAPSNSIPSESRFVVTYREKIWDLQVGNDKGQVIVYGPADRKLANALQNLLRESVSAHRTFAYFFNQAVESILA
jgi:hypothetical protein